MWSNDTRGTMSFNIVELPQTVPCVTKVDGSSRARPKPLSAIGPECGEPTKQALLITGIPNMGKKKVQMPCCDGHVKIYTGESKGGIQFNEGPRPTMSPNMCPDCGKHPVGQQCRLGPRRLP